MIYLFLFTSDNFYAFPYPCYNNNFIAAYNQPRNLIKGFDKELFDHQTIHYLGNVLYLAICKKYMYITCYGTC